MRSGIGKGNGDGSKATRFVAKTNCADCNVDLTAENKRQGRCIVCARKRDVARVLAWRAANPEKAQAMARATDRKRQGKPHRVALSIRTSRRWREANRERWRALIAVNQGKRRAAGRVGSLTVDEWFAQLEAFGHRCAYCLRGGVALSMDHVDPLSRGGAHAIENIVPACKSCNSRKQARGPLSMVNRLADFDT